MTFKKGDKVIVHSNGEVRAIGAGFRPVRIMSIGPKHVRLYLGRFKRKTSVKIRRKVWDEISKGGKTYA